MTDLTTDFIKDIEPFFYRRRIVYVDVGAHRGAVYQDFARSGLGIREAHLIEPNPRSFAVLEKAAEAIGGVRLVSCHPLALGAEPGRLRLRAADSMTKVLGAAGDAPAPEAEPAAPAEAGKDGELLERARHRMLKAWARRPAWLRGADAGAGAGAAHSSQPAIQTGE